MIDCIYDVHKSDRVEIMLVQLYYSLLCVFNVLYIYFVPSE